MANQNHRHLTADCGQYTGQGIISNCDLIPVEFLVSPIDFTYGEQVQLLKNDPLSVCVVRYRNTCIKHYKSRGFKDVLKVWSGQSKGKKSFRWALSMVDRSIKTPTPFCYLESRTGDSFYLSRFIDSAPNMVTYLRKTPPAKRQAYLTPLAHFLNRMFQKKTYHLDLKGSNILVTDVGSEPEFYLIDTDEIAILKKDSNRYLKKCLTRITRSLSEFFNRQELLAFIDVCLCDLPPLFADQSSYAIVDNAFKIQAGKDPGGAQGSKHAGF